jgi:hypothetical protein
LLRCKSNVFGDTTLKTKLPTPEPLGDTHKPCPNRSTLWLHSLSRKRCLFCGHICIVPSRGAHLRTWYCVRNTGSAKRTFGYGLICPLWAFVSSLVNYNCLVGGWSIWWSLETLNFKLCSSQSAHEHIFWFNKGLIQKNLYFFKSHRL